MKFLRNQNEDLDRNVNKDHRNYDEATWNQVGFYFILKEHLETLFDCTKIVIV